MTTPVPSAPVGPLLRALLEALESVVSRDQTKFLLRNALLLGKLERVPEQPEAFARFVYGPLTQSLRTAGDGVAELVVEQLGHVVRLVSAHRERQATGTGDDADELSGERETLPPPDPKSSGPRRTDLATALRENDDVPLIAPVLFPGRGANDSGTLPKRAIARVTSPALPARSSQPSQARSSRPSYEEVRASSSGARAIATDVVVVSLDPKLVIDVETRMAGKSRVRSAVTIEELRHALARAASQRVAIVLDTGVPSIDVATFARLAGELPALAHVILWGTDERQRLRLASLFPQARTWVASGAAESPADMLLAADGR